MKKKREKASQLVRRGESPEEALFRNVIVQAIQDATMAISQLRAGASRERLEAIRRQARNWIKVQGEDFKTVCALAGLEAQRVRQFAMAKIRESIEQESAKTAELLTSTMPGVVSNFSQRLPDRPGSDAQDGEKIEFSQNEVSP